MAAVRFKHVQGLRAVAVLSVVIFHFNKNWLPGGFIGVDIFFVISGFLITGIILKRSERGLWNPVTFYIGRIKRIVPAYLVMLWAVAFICYYVMVWSPDFSDFCSSLYSALMFNSAQYFGSAGGYFSPQAYELPLQHTWTLAVEMQFYLLLPFVIAVFPRRVLSLIFFVAIALITAYSQYLLWVGPMPAIYFSLVARIPEFLIGAICATARSDRQLSVRSRQVASCIGAILFVLSFYAIHEGTLFPGVTALAPCVATALFLISEGGLFKTLLNSSIMVAVGDVSFSLYLWHWPVLAMLRYINMAEFLPAKVVCLAIVIIVACSCGSYYLIEMPFRRSKSVVFALTLIAACTITVVLFNPMKSTQIQQMVKEVPGKDLFLLTDAASGYKFMYDRACFGNVHGDCSRGSDKTTEAPILVIGDSHAAQLAAFFDVVDDTFKRKSRIIASPSCATIPGLDKGLIGRSNDSICQNQTTEVLKYLDQSNPIVIAASWEGFNPQALQQVKTFVVSEQTRGKTILVFSEIPSLSYNPARLLYLAKLGLPKWLMHKSGTLDLAPSEANSNLSKSLNSAGQNPFVNLSNLPIFNKPPYFDGELMFFNHNHLSEIGSAVYGEQALDTLKPLLASPSQ